MLTGTESRMAEVFGALIGALGGVAEDVRLAVCLQVVLP